MLVTIVTIALTISLGAVAIEAGLLNIILPKGDNDQSQNTNETTGLPDTIPNPEPTPTPIDTTPNDNDIDDTQPEPGPVPEPIPVPDPKPTPVPIFTPVPVPEPTPTPVPEPVTVPETHDYSGKGNGYTGSFYVDGFVIFHVQVDQASNAPLDVYFQSSDGMGGSYPLIEDRTGSYHADVCIGTADMPDYHAGKGSWYIEPGNYHLKITATGEWSVDVIHPSGKGRVLPQTFKGSTDAVYSLGMWNVDNTSVKFELSYSGAGHVAVYLWSWDGYGYIMASTETRAVFIDPDLDGVTSRTMTFGGNVPDENFGPWYHPPEGVYYLAIVADDANYTVKVS